MSVYPKRAKLLLLLEYLRRHTDERHPKKLTDMLEYLSAQGIEAERKAVYADIALLRELGFDIVRPMPRIFFATSMLASSKRDSSIMPGFSKNSAAVLKAEDVSSMPRKLM